MIVTPIENGIAITPDTEFDHEYLNSMFFNKKRKTYYNHDSGCFNVWCDGEAVESDPPKENK